jgi:hypothetical protein
VKQRLRDLVDAKVRDVQQRIAEQVAFAAELQASLAALASTPVDGPCDDGCGCTSDVAAGTGRPVALVPSEQRSAPIACTLAGDDVPARVEAWQSVLTHAIGRDAIGGGVRVTFGPTASVSTLADLVAAEQSCCSFLAFAITIDARGLALEVTAPADAQPVVAALFGAAA